MQLASSSQSVPEEKHLGPRSDVRHGSLRAVLPLNNLFRPMTNWTRFFPMLLAAHRNLGTICPPSSSSPPTNSDQIPRGPALSLMVLTCLLVGVVIVTPARGGDRPGIVRGVVESAESGEPLPGANVAVRTPSDSALVGGQRPTAPDTS